MALLVGVVPLTLIGVFLSEPLLRLMQVPDDGTLEMAKTYMIIIFIGVIGNLGFNINAGILQGFGDSRTSLLFLMIATRDEHCARPCLHHPDSDGRGGRRAGHHHRADRPPGCSASFTSTGATILSGSGPAVPISARRCFVQAMRLGIPSGIQQALFSHRHHGHAVAGQLLRLHLYGGLQRRQQDRHLRLPAGAEPVQRS